MSDPTDDVTAHIGWMHIWRLSERSPLAAEPATITDDAIVSRKYFEEAVKLHPGEARYAGFLAAVKLAEADIHKDERSTREAYFDLMNSVDAWPELNLFTAGYVMSLQRASSENFRNALRWQWKNLDACRVKNLTAPTLTTVNT